jgi:hypothetical protein
MSEKKSEIDFGRRSYTGDSSFNRSGSKNPSTTGAG